MSGGYGSAIARISVVVLAGSAWFVASSYAFIAIVDGYTNIRYHSWTAGSYRDQLLAGNHDLWAAIYTGFVWDIRWQLAVLLPGLVGGLVCFALYRIYRWARRPAFNPFGDMTWADQHEQRQNGMRRRQRY